MIIGTTSTGHLIFYIKVPLYFSLKFNGRHFCFNVDLAKLVILSSFLLISSRKHASVYSLKNILRRLKCLFVVFCHLRWGLLSSSFYENLLKWPKLANFSHFLCKWGQKMPFEPFSVVFVKS